MKHKTKRGTLLALPPIVAWLALVLAGQDLATGMVASLERVAAVSESRVIPTVTDANTVYAVEQAPGSWLRTEVAGGVTQAFGISRGRLAYTVDEDLYQLDLRTNERTRLLEDFRVVGAAWKPSSLVLAAVVRGQAGLGLVTTEINTGAIDIVQEDSVRPGFLSWGEDGYALFYLVNDAEGQIRLVWRESRDLSGSSRIDEAAVPFLAAASDSALRFGQLESELRVWMERGTLIPVGRMAGGVLAHSIDGSRVFFAPSPMEERLIPLTEAAAKAETRTSVQAASSFDTYLGEFQGVAVYSNGSSSYYSGVANYVGSTYTGIKWQCVEYVRRFYLQTYGLDLAAQFRGDANQWYDNASQMNLERFSNGGAAPPEVGDIIASDSGPSGHIAIVRSRSANQVCTAQQNYSNDGSDVNRCLTLTVSGSTYTLSGFSQNYPIRGWLRRRSTTAEISSPTPGSTLTGSGVTFTWTSGSSVSRYWLYVGTSVGTNNLYGADQGTNRSVSVNNLPTDGRILHVRLWSYLNGGWQYNDYTYRSATFTTATKALMSTPTPGSTLTGSGVTFTWTSGSSVSRYWLYVGTSVGTNNLYGADQGTNRSVSVNNLPTDGRILHVRLWSYLNGGWQYNDYTYRSATITAATKALMSAPTPGSTLSGSSVMFTWTSGTNVSRYWLYVGTSVGTNNLYGADQGTNRSVTVNNLPTDGRILHVRLWSYLNGGWQYNDYTYRAR